jgi:hypothetical protein
MICRARVAASASSPWQRMRSFATTKNPSSRSKISAGGGDNQRSSSASAAATSISEMSSSSSSQNYRNTRRVVRRKSKESSSSETNRRSKQAPAKDWKKDDKAQHHFAATKAVPVIQPSIYYYCTQAALPLGVDKKDKSGDKGYSRLVLPAMNASALLDPLKYCKTSSRLSQNRVGVSRSISGGDAARRLLRGKKDFIVAARALKTQPALLEGHGVPQQLFQHCIDMADALLLQYSPDVVECTFHNYTYFTGESKVPDILRIRR